MFSFFRLLLALYIYSFYGLHRYDTPKRGKKKGEKKIAKQ